MDNVNKISVVIATLVGIVIIFLVYYYVIKPALNEGLSYQNWVKYPGYFSLGGNIIQYPHFSGDINWMARKCMTTPGCKGFSTDGWLKNGILPRNQWTRVSNKDALYVRT